MGSQVVSYAVDDTVVQFEIDPDDDWVEVGADQVIAKVKEAVRPAVTAARAVVAEVAQLAPGDIEVKFGIKVNGSAHWLVAKASTEANFEVTLAWHHRGAAPGESDHAAEVQAPLP
jgi:hypothetical protein